MTDTAPAGRESRTCAKCGLTDDHAHHVQYVAFVHPVTSEPTDLSVSKHVQCCAEDGCPICAIDLSQAGDTNTDVAIGAAFTEFMQHKPDGALQALFAEHHIESPAFVEAPATEETAS